MFRTLSLILFLTYFTSVSQSYIGFDADNFNGIHGALFNPANIADSKTKIDLNLASVSLFAVNNYTALNYFKLFTDFDNFSTAFDLENIGIDRKNNGIVNSDILGPSVLITINKKHSIGLFTRARALINANTLDGKIIDFFETGLRDNRDLQIADVNSSIVINNFAEVGLTYARVLKDDRVEFLKGGATFKYIRGFGSATAYVEDGVAFYNSNNSNSVFLDGGVEYTYSSNFDRNNNGQIGTGDDNEFPGNFKGLGLDLGIVYEYRPEFRENISRDNVKEQKVLRHIPNYKYKIGVSLLDIGYINYKNQRLKGYSPTTITRQDVLNISSINNIEETFNPSDASEDRRLWLPARLRAEFDLKLNKKFYLNGVTNLSLVSKKSKAANRYANQFTVSPRYETKWFTAQIPVTLTQYGGVQVGLGGRLGPIFIGSSGFFSRTFDKRTRAFDIYAGLKIPIYHKTPKPATVSNPNGETDVTRFNCTEGCPPVKKDKVKRFRSYKGQFDKK